MKLFFTFLLIAGSFSLVAQSRAKKYDSIYYENLFTPNFSNLLMPKGYTEVLISNSFLTANQLWSGDHTKLDLGRRYTYNFLTVVANLGLTENRRFNAGVEMHYGMANIDADKTSSPFNIFKSSSPTMVDYAQSVTSIGPRIKWRPIKRNLNFVYITTYQIPTINDAHKQSLLGQNKYWANQFIYSFGVGSKLAFFAEEDIYTYFKGLSPYNQYINSLNVYVYLLVSKHLFPFASLGYSASFGNTVDGFKKQSQYIPVGLGLQYQYSLQFTVNLYASKYVWGDNYTNWTTVNLGLRKVF